MPLISGNTQWRRIKGNVDTKTLPIQEEDAKGWTVIINNLNVTTYCFIDSFIVIIIFSETRLYSSCKKIEKQSSFRKNRIVDLFST